jgi:coenzyme F420-0:L-glutamate ligase/coenzyme F420-1:gamma-L-glutamate ligase
MSSEVHVIGLKDLPDITPGMNLARIIAGAIRAQTLSLNSQDILVVTQKIVSKAENRLVRLSQVTPSPFAAEVARAQDKEASLVEVVLGESKRIVRMDQRTIIAETHHGFVCANAGVDESNVAGSDTVALLPVDADASANRLRNDIQEITGIAPAVIISDTFGRPWREGLVNVAIGVAGIDPLKDYRGLQDTEGRTMKMTALAVADELASAAELVMGKLDRVPVALIRGYAYTASNGSARQLVRSPEKDLFR